MTEKLKRRRLTLAAMMTGIAALALLMVLGLPILRQGPPQCMSAAATARWLASPPGTASCLQCHIKVSSMDRLRALLPVVAAEPPRCAAGFAGGATSCLNCHAK